MLVTVGKTVAQGWSGIKTLGKRKDRPRDQINQQICLPESFVPQVLHVLHNSPSAGHLGVSKILEN